MKLTITDNNNRVLTIDGTYQDYDDIICMLKSILEFLGYNAEGVCNQITENQREV